MQIKILHTQKSERISEFCQIILDHTLHAWGDMRYWCINHQDNTSNRREILCAVLAYDDLIPVGSLIYVSDVSWNNYNVGTFVREDYRRRGIGRSLMKRIEGLNPKPWTESYLARHFYCSIGVAA